MPEFTVRDYGAQDGGKKHGEASHRSDGAQPFRSRYGWHAAATGTGLVIFKEGEQCAERGGYGQQAAGEAHSGQFE